MTIGKAVANYTPKRKKDSPKSVHLVGTDTPEVILVLPNSENQKTLEYKDDCQTQVQILNGPINMRQSNCAV